jgi:hypothetical protein
MLIFKQLGKYVQMDNEHIREQHNKFSPLRNKIKENVSMGVLWVVIDVATDDCGEVN